MRDLDYLRFEEGQCGKIGGIFNLYLYSEGWFEGM